VQTRFFQGRYGDLQSSVLSYGPCQAPTLGFVVQRHLEIEMFKPEPYWVLDLGLMKSGRMCRLNWSFVHSFNKNKIERTVLDLFDASKPFSYEPNENLTEEPPPSRPICKVTQIVKREKKQGRPTPMNTVAFLKACSKGLGIGPHQALGVAERLYLSGYLSYPRTESSSYPKSFDLAGTLQAQSSDGRWGNYVRKLLANGINHAKGGFDAGDHPPITPTFVHAGPYDLSGDSACVYELVVRHFIATISNDAIWLSTKVDFTVDRLKIITNERLWGEFNITGKQLIDPGFLEVLLHRQYVGRASEASEAVRTPAGATMRHFRIARFCDRLAEPTWDLRTPRRGNRIM